MVYLSEERKNRLKEIKEMYGMPYSQMFRIAIEFFLKKFDSASDYFDLELKLKKEENRRNKEYDNDNND